MMTRLAPLLLALVLAGCAAKPMPACEFVVRHDLWFRQTTAALSAGLGHPDSPAALADNIAALEAIEAEVKAADVSEDGRALQTDTILAIEQGIAQLQWLKADGSAAATIPEFAADAHDLIQALEDVMAQAGVLRLQCEEPK